MMILPDIHEKSSPADTGFIGVLDEDQEKVAEHTLGPSLVAGSPGSGKTRCVIARVVRLVQQGVAPEHILVITFTRSACGEIQSRLATAGISGVEVRTFHSLCFNRLRLVWASGMAQTVFDERGALPFHLKKVARDLKRSGVIKPVDVLDLKILETFISRVKNMGAFPVHGNPFGVDPTLGKHNVLQVAEDWLCAKTGLDPEDGWAIYEAYEERRWGLSLYDYDDAQGWLWLALAGSEDIRRWWASQWSVVIVDEGQDSSAVQHSMARLAVGLPDYLIGSPKTERDHNLMLVADTSQSLYSWRNAVPEEILRYIKDQGPAVYTLPNNYRSTDVICELASEVVSGRPWHLTGRIRPVRKVLGVPIELRTFVDRREEMAFALQVAREEGPGRVAILSRTSSILHWLSILCTREGIPFRRLMGGFIFDSRESRDLLNYLRAGAGLDSDGSALRSIVNVPFRYIGAKAFEAVSRHPRAEGRTLLEDLLEHGDLKYPQRRSILRLKDVLTEIMHRSGQPPEGTLAWLVQEIDYESHLAEEMGLSTSTGDEGSSIILEELIAYAASFSTISELLTHVEMLRGLHQAQKQMDSSPTDHVERLTLATIHSIKGLQSPVVILADVSHGRFPNGNVRQDPVLGEEELRLLYVAISRAQDRLCITRSKGSAGGRDSPFWRLLENHRKKTLSA